MWTQVVLTERALEIVLAAARAALPAEMVAVLGGDNLGDTAIVRDVMPLANSSPSPPDRADTAGQTFDVDPVAFARGEHELRRRGQPFLGFVHSHPDASAQPSLSDRGTLWRDCLQLIVGPVAGDGEPTVHAFVLRGSGPLATSQPVPLAIEVPR